MAFQQAASVLGWYKNLQPEEVPKKDIWLDNKRLDAHFSKIRSKWRNGRSEAPDGTLSDAQQGKNVTLSNALVDQVMSSMTHEGDNFMEI